MKLPKQLLLFNTLSVVFLIMLCNSKIYSQTENSGGLSMPFYGIVQEYVRCYYFLISQAQYDIVINGAHIPFGMCQGSDCPNLGCYCPGTGGFESDEYTLTMGTPVNTEIRKCYGGPGWTTLEHQFVVINPPPSPYDKAYNIEAKEPEGEFKVIGAMRFTEIPDPPGCILTTDNCDEIITNPIEFHIEEYDNTVGGIEDVCIENPDRLAFFSYRPQVGSGILATNFFNEYNKDNIRVCFNRQRQILQFEVIPDPDWNVVVDLCYDNIQGHFLTIIESIEDIPEKIPRSLCFKALRSFKGHFEYPYKIKDYGYVIKDVLLTHERTHKKQFKDDYLEWYYPVLNQLLYEFRPECNDYDDLETLKSDAYDKYNLKVSQYASEIAFQYDWYQGFHKIYESYPQIQKEIRDQIENDTNTDPNVIDTIQEYINALEAYCNG